jgi:hypothetical protein
MWGKFLAHILTQSKGLEMLLIIKKQKGETPKTTQKPELPKNSIYENSITNVMWLSGL